MSPDCDKYQEKLSSWLDGQLSPTEAGELEAHLEHCAECSAIVRRLKSLSGMASEALLDIDDSVLEELEQRITDSIENLPDQAVEQKPTRITPIWFKYAAAAAVVVLVFSIGQFAFKEPNRPLWDGAPSPSPVPVKESAEPPAVETDDAASVDGEIKIVAEDEPESREETDQLQYQAKPVRAQDKKELGKSLPTQTPAAPQAETNLKVIADDKQQFIDPDRAGTAPIKSTEDAEDLMADEEVTVRGARSQETVNELTVDGIDVVSMEEAKVPIKSMAGLRVQSDEEPGPLSLLYKAAVGEFVTSKKLSKAHASMTAQSDSLPVYWYVVYDRSNEKIKPDDMAGRVEQFYITARGNYDLYRITKEESFYNRAWDLRETAIKLIEKELKEKPVDSKLHRYLEEIGAWQIKK